MRTRLRVVAGPVLVLALCAGFLAHAQNREATPKDGKKGAQKNVATEKSAAQPAQPAAKPATKSESAEGTRTPSAGKAADANNEQESADEKEIRDSAAAFTELYNQHDSK